MDEYGVVHGLPLCIIVSGGEQNKLRLNLHTLFLMKAQNYKLSRASNGERWKMVSEGRLRAASSQLTRFENNFRRKCPKPIFAQNASIYNCCLIIIILRMDEYMCGIK